ncbi:MAG: phenylacetic acid degradation operon negative regulatory protein [Parcubacteria group bacterium Gr01-1014_70]|nr:MAG: phenylacetic acid degradation operon negative regulatory protein [Parcubacteria group bacterium Gr01-1014_70]
MRSHKNSEIIEAINFVPEEVLPRVSSRIPLSDIVLASIAVAGVLSVALIAPNAVKLLKYVKLKKKPTYDLPYRIPETLRRLEKQGIITIVHDDMFSARAVLTEQGRQLLLKKKNAHAISRFEKPKQWDGKWRFVIFDVKEKRRTRRDRFRDELKQIGFLRVQNSVWAFPYECSDLISLLKMEKEIGGEVLYLEADNVEDEKNLRRRFNI